VLSFWWGRGYAIFAFEARLIQDERAVWLERAEIRKVLEEQSLQAIFSPQAVAERAAMGKLLKADLLVLLREVSQQDSEAYLELIVCETAHGLRLCRHLMPIAGPAEAKAAHVVEAVDLAIKKSAEQIDEVWAVPPLLSEDLTDPFAPLKQAYAYVIQQVLLAEKGVLVVELAEARAVAQEMELAGAGEEVSRRLPVYVNGKFRNQVQQRRRRLSIELQAVRGSKVLQKLAAADLPPEEVTQFLRNSAAKLLKAAAGKEVTIGQREPEAKQLARRAKEFADTGQWLEALALYEASLLLNPRDVEVLQAMQIVLIRLTHAAHNARRRDWSNPERAATFFMYHDRAWQCLEAIYRSHPSPWLVPYSDLVHPLTGDSSWLRFSLYDGEVSDDVRKRCDESIRLKEDVLVEIICRVAATDPRPPNATELLKTLGSELWGLQGREYTATLRAVKSVADLPHGEQYAVAIARRLRELSGAYYPRPSQSPLPISLGRYSTPPVAELFQFVDELQASSSPALRAAAVELSGVYEIDRITPAQRRQFEAEYARRLAEVEREREEHRQYRARNVRPRNVPLPPSGETPPRSPVALADPKPIKTPRPPRLPDEFRSGGIVFRPVWFYDDTDMRSTSSAPHEPSLNLDIMDVFPAADGVDVVRPSRSCIYLMRQKGRLERVWQCRQSDRAVCAACYDGKFIWGSTSTGSDANPCLVVIDLADKRVWTFTDRTATNCLSPSLIRLAWG
jgi:tetratricopeptide (TPR) repeat protein